MPSVATISPFLRPKSIHYACRAAEQLVGIHTASVSKLHYSTWEQHTEFSLVSRFLLVFRDIDFFALSQS